MSLKELLYDNGCLKDTEQWKIYWKCCQEVQDVLKQNFPHVGMALHLIFFNIELWEQDNFDNEEVLESLDTTNLPDDEPDPTNVKSDGCLFKPIIEWSKVLFLFLD